MKKKKNTPQKSCTLYSGSDCTLYSGFSCTLYSGIFNQRKKARKEAAERNFIEGRFGQGKNGYRLNEIRARLKATSESWVACIFFVMNLIHYEKVKIFCSIYRWLEGVLSEICAILQPMEPKTRLVYLDIINPDCRLIN